MPVELSIRARKAIASQFPQLLLEDDEELFFEDTLDQMGLQSLHHDGRTPVHFD